MKKNASIDLKLFCTLFRSFPALTVCPSNPPSHSRTMALFTASSGKSVLVGPRASHITTTSDDEGRCDLAGGSDRWSRSRRRRLADLSLRLLQRLNPSNSRISIHSKIKDARILEVLLLSIVRHASNAPLHKCSAHPPQLSPLFIRNQLQHLHPSKHFSDFSPRSNLTRSLGIKRTSRLRRKVFTAVLEISAPSSRTLSFCHLPALISDAAAMVLSEASFGTPRTL